METTIDGAGRLVIPKPLREQLQLRGGDHVEINENEGVLEIRPTPRPVTVERSGGRPRLRAEGDTPELTVEDVRALLDEGRK